jgi:hypothetical protein
MLRAGAKVTVPIVGAVDGRVVGGCLEALVTENWLFKARVSVWRVTLIGRCLSWAASGAIGRSLARADGEGVSLVWLFGCGRFCEHLFDQACGGSGMNEGAGRCHQRVVVALLLFG